MDLSDLQLNRQLYKTQPQTPETLGASDVAANTSPAPSTAIASGNSVTDVNTNAEQINGAVIEPGTIPPSTLDIANFGWTQTCPFSVVDADTVSWTSGVFTSANGVAYSISGGSTGNMVAKTYIYLDINVSTTAYQMSTNQTAPIGIGKVLIAVCENGGTTATYILVQATQIVADNIIANTITAQKMNVGQLSAITADLGSITAGTITGVLIRTATSGERIEITSSPHNLINFYDSSTLYGSLEVTNSGGDGYINLTSVDGGGLYLNTGVGASNFSSAFLEAQGGSVGVSGNASNGFATSSATGGAGTALMQLSASGASTDATLVADNVVITGGNTVEIDSPTLVVDNDIDVAVRFHYRTVSQPILYTGYCSGTTIVNSNVSWSLTNPSTGKYTVTHNLNLTTYNVVATTLKGSGAGDHVCKIESMGNNDFKVTTFTANDGVVSNSDFMFLLVRLA